MERLRQYEIFYKKARTDFAMAAVARSSDNEDIDNEAILFHLQQSVEKLLKSLLAFHNISTEKTHDIEMIAKKCHAANLSLPVCVDRKADWLCCRRYKTGNQGRHEMKKLFFGILPFLVTLTQGWGD